MFSQILLLLTTLVSLAITSPQGIQSILRTQDSECTSDIHMIVVRATTEAQGYGALGKIVNETCEQLPGATSEAIDYPANGLNSFTEYAESETTGIENTTKAIQAYAQRCPESRIALLGYSQGAQVIGDVLCGRSEKHFSHIYPLSQNYTQNIHAVLQLGDPSNIMDLPWHNGTSTGRGIFPRTDFSPCNSFGGFWQSWCDDKDPFCSWPGQNFSVHFGYVNKYHVDMVDFLVGQVKDALYDDEL